MTQASQDKIKILQVDQWTSTGNVKGTKLEDWERDRQGMLSSRSGGDSEAIQQIFGGSARVREVRESETPDLGEVWFRPDADGVLELWKANYDSSD